MKRLESSKFKDNDFELNVYISADEKTVWLTKDEIAFLFDRDRTVISRHIKNILEENETSTDSVCAKFARTGNDGKTYQVDYYNLEIILVIGYRIKSNRGVLLKSFLDEYLNKKYKDLDNEIIIYNNGNINLSVNISPKEETVWLSANQMSILFGTSVDNIYLHIKNIYLEEELDNSVAEDSSVTQKETLYLASDGKQYSTKLFNLDIILNVGYRVKSKRAIQFRKWANNVLKKYLIKGYAINEERLLINKDSYLRLENDVAKIKDDIVDLKQKTFIEAPKERLFFDGEYFDAYEFIASLVSNAKCCVVIIDPYFDIKGLNILKKAKNNIRVTVCLSNQARLIQNDVDEFEKQFFNIVIKEIDNFHDRFLIIDDKECYSLGTSLNYMGKKTFAINKIEDNDIIQAILNKALKTNI